MPTVVTEERRGFGWVDVVIFAALVLAPAVGLWVVRGMSVPFSPTEQIPISLDPGLLPYYAARTWVRMMVALAGSFAFSLLVGYAAAHSRTIERVTVPALDILQSVPVLGFLSVTVTGFMSLFPGNLMGLECASIFAIFTSQVWNMTYAFYHSLKTLPPNLDEPARMFRLNRWQRFLKAELPYAMVPLMWNTMMSISGGWFFVVASERISVLNHDVQLPGLGTYISRAIEAGDYVHAAQGTAAMLLTIVVMTVFITRPLVVWALKFRYEHETGERTSYFVLEWLEQSKLMRIFGRWIGRPLDRWLDHFWKRTGRWAHQTVAAKVPLQSGRLLRIGFLTAVAVVCGFGAWLCIEEIRLGFTWPAFGQVLGWSGLTLLRVAAVVALSSLIWVPIGVWIGLRPKLAHVAQPTIDVLAAFPVNCTYPIAVIFFVWAGISLNWGSILLLMLGAQWYILFNVIAGASRIPSDLREVSRAYRLNVVQRWRKMILPAIFPNWVTGALTAAGGAWNATIVAEVALWGRHKMEAQGLGAYIAKATESGEWPAIIFGIAMMTVLVVGINRYFWKPLYAYAEKKFTLD